MARRLQLHDELINILGSNNVYFQPPASMLLHYPCIKYNLSGGLTEYADNKAYAFTRKYDIMLIHPDPDNEIIEKLVFAFPAIQFDRMYTADNLNHYVYTLYY